MKFQQLFTINLRTFHKRSKDIHKMYKKTGLCLLILYSKNNIVLSVHNLVVNVIYMHKTF